MEEIYNSEDFAEVKKQKKKIKAVYFSVLGVFVAFAAAMLTLYLLQPYRSPNITWIKVATYIGTGIFVIFSFIYLGIPMKRIRNYNKILHGMEIGTNNETVGNFERYSEEIEIKDGIEYKALYFMEYNTKKQEFYERKVMFDSEKPFPEFTKGENVRYFTHGNILVSYEKI